MALRFLTAGESHGPSLTAILEGMPAGLELDRAELARQMRRRQAGFGSGGRMKIERDEARISAGVMAGLTTGAPIAITIPNLDYASWTERDIPPMTIPRPGHADLTATIKYGYRDLRLALERASARETAARVAVGAICAQLLGAFGITVGSYVVEIGGEAFDAEGCGAPDYAERFALAEADELRCPDPEASGRMRAAIQAAIRAKDTVGGVFEVVALGVPPGLGSHVHWDRRLGGLIAGALASIPAIKGVEIGSAWGNARRHGTEAQDRLVVQGGKVLRQGPTRSGGLEGGITTGGPIVLRAAMKPIATTLTPQESVDLATGLPAPARYERSDFCAVPRAAVVGEAMVAFVLAGALIEKLGGDSIAEMRPRLAALARAEAELELDGRPWRFGYEL